MKLVFHVGVHKTGTSALQAFLNQNKLALREKGLWYDPPAGHDSHNAVVQAFQKPSSVGPDLLKAELKKAADNNCAICLFSSEQFCEHPFEVGKFTAAVEGHELLVIAYIRPADEMIVSAHNELVRFGWTTTVSERLSYDPTYRTILHNWLGERPWKLVIAPYDKAQWLGGTLFSDFLSMLDIDSNGLEMSVPRNQSNRSLPPALAEVLRIANRFDLGPNRAAFQAGLFELWDQHPGMYDHGSLLTDDERQDYRRRFEKQVEIYRPYFRPGFDTKFLMPVRADEIQ